MGAQRLSAIDEQTLLIVRPAKPFCVGAQRLSAIDEQTPYHSSPSILVHHCAQRLSAIDEQTRIPLRTYETFMGVLNAFRRSTNKHIVSGDPECNGEECSTPFGDRRTNTCEKGVTKEIRKLCSTPFGDRRTNTQRPSMSFLQRICAQRLSAIDEQTHSDGWRLV